MFEIAFIAALIVGMIRGGSLGRLAKLPFRFPWLVIISLGIQVLLGAANYFFPVPKILGFLLVSASYLILISALFFNRKEFNLQIIMVGILLNFLVIAINGGMPISLKSARLLNINERKFVESVKKDYKHVVDEPNTTFGFLGDVIPLPPPYPLPGLYSIGDVFISIGLFLYIQAYLVYRGKRVKHSGHQPLLN